MPDPASVDVEFTITGLSPTEAAALLAEVPERARFVADVTQPALGPRRYLCTVSGLSIVGAINALDAQLRLFDRQSEPTSVD